jgi:hypothetical protein
MYVCITYVIGIAIVTMPMRGGGSEVVMSMYIYSCLSEAKSVCFRRSYIYIYINIFKHNIYVNINMAVGKWIPAKKVKTKWWQTAKINKKSPNQNLLLNAVELPVENGSNLRIDNGYNKDDPGSNLSGDFTKGKKAIENGQNTSIENNLDDGYVKNRDGLVNQFLYTIYVLLEAGDDVYLCRLRIVCHLNCIYIHMYMYLYVNVYDIHIFTNSLNFIYIYIYIYIYMYLYISYMLMIIIHIYIHTYVNVI